MLVDSMYFLSIFLLHTAQSTLIYNSCETAFAQGSGQSGKHTIWKSGIPPLDYDPQGDPPAPNLLDEVWCDLTTFGGGWTLIAFSDPLNNWPTIDYNFNPRRTSEALDGMSYSPDWDRDHSFYRIFDTDSIQEDWIMFRAGENGDTYCAFERTAVLEISLLGNIKATTILGSEGTAMRHGELTNHMFTGNSDKAHPLVGCEGTYQENQARLLWAENGAGLGVSWKNQHGGIGVFVRSADVAPPVPVLGRIADSNHSQVQVVFSEAVKDANGWVEPNIDDFVVKMGPLTLINMTEYMLINATFPVNGTYYSNATNYNYTNYTTSYQEWYNKRSTVARPGGDPISGDIAYGTASSTWISTQVYGYHTWSEYRRLIPVTISSASITADGNLTLQLQKDVPYGTGINVRYIKEPNNFNSRYDRHISDVFHNVVKDFFVECDNQINPMLAEAVGKTKSHFLKCFFFTFSYMIFLFLFSFKTSIGTFTFHYKYDIYR